MEKKYLINYTKQALRKKLNNMKIHYIFIIMLFFSCKGEKKVYKQVEKKTNINFNQKYTDSLFNEAILKNDTIAYNKFMYEYWKRQKYSELFYYSLLMANINNSNEAYYNLFLIMDNDTPLTKEVYYKSNDKNSIRLKYYYLLKSYENGNKSAKYLLDNKFGKNNYPKSQDYFVQD